MYQSPKKQHGSHGAATSPGGADELDLTRLAISYQSTPRAQGKGSSRSVHQHQEHPPRTSKPRQYGDDDDGMEQLSTPRLPATSRRQPAFPAFTPTTPSAKGKSAAVPASAMTKKTPSNDPVMHRMLDKTYRVQATPHEAKSRPKYAMTPNKNNQSSARYPYESPASSPEPEAPKLRSEFFPSLKTVETPDTVRHRTQTRGRGDAANGVSKPGISVLTPAAHNRGNERQRRSLYLDDVDDLDDDADVGISPPKTMQFHIPQSRLMKTPGTSLFRFLFAYIARILIVDL